MKRLFILGLLILILILLFGPITLYASEIKEIDKEQYMKGLGYNIPSSIKDGTAKLWEIEKWTKSIRNGEKLINKDLNADDCPEILAEFVDARGSTGNHTYLLFTSTGKGYKFVQEISNIGRTLTYDHSGRSYIITSGKISGREIIVKLSEFINYKLIPIGKPITIFVGDSGTQEDNFIYNRLFKKIMRENDLINIFKK